MLKESQAELFIRLLSEELETDRIIRQMNLSAKNKAEAERYKRLFVSDIKASIRAHEPQDCFQMMEDNS